ncbi:hypothetical protein CDO52_21535 [Nocardiopsis gilva YIM 90087]|uniref:Uncharacterized protein n=1 Tax=Nocardiopsis gilva YIM 90087 TaxID=1235441 RepID=A0A223SA82_9ACTN|nr:hypothetical protein [Nocardiopsis gilva]ASU85031.1 hypothetical protein CDO52_21535 [Nocardiopsis gilva YIM 90087]
MPIDLKTVRVLLFIIGGISVAGFFTFALADLNIDSGTQALSVITFALQAAGTLTLAASMAPRRSWVFYGTIGYTALALLFSLITFNILTLVVFALIGFFALRPASRAYLRGTPA